MTVVVGIPCNNGIVLAADQQISAPGWHKYHESKLFKIEGFGDWVVVLGYAGLPSLANEAHEKIVARLLDVELSDISTFRNDQVREVIETILAEMAQQHFGQLDLSMLIASSCGKGYPDLWKFSDTGFHSIFAEFAVLGVGDSSLIRYLQQMHSVHDPIEIGESLAVFFVEKAKQNIDGCGGKTDVITVKSNGEWRLLSETEIKEKIDKDASSGKRRLAINPSWLISSPT